MRLGKQKTEGQGEGNIRALQGYVFRIGLYKRREEAEREKRHADENSTKYSRSMMDAHGFGFLRVVHALRSTCDLFFFSRINRNLTKNDKSKR